jgi:hypothetical protein
MDVLVALQNTEGKTLLFQPKFFHRLLKGFARKTSHAYT